MSAYDDDSQLPLLLDKAFKDTKEVVFWAWQIWQGAVYPTSSCKDMVKPKNLSDTLQKLGSAVCQAKESINKVEPDLTIVTACTKFANAHEEALWQAEAIMTFVAHKLHTGKWPNNFDRSPSTKTPYHWDMLINACYREAHRAAAKDEEFGVVKRTAERHLQILPGGIGCKDATGEDVSVQVGGKTLAIIRELIDAYQQQLDWTKLSQRIWGTDAYTDKATIKNVVADARDALRKLARKAGKRVTKNYDPLPCVNRGKDL